MAMFKLVNGGNTMKSILQANKPIKKDVFKLSLA